MPLSPADLTQPIGDLSPDLFPVLPGESYANPGDKLETLLYTWITLAEAATADPSAQMEYAYWRAKSAACGRMLGTPGQVAVEGKGSYSFTDTQRAAVCAQAEAHRQAFVATTAPAEVAPRRRGSVVVNRAAVWAGDTAGDEYGAAPNGGNTSAYP